MAITRKLQIAGDSMLPPGEDPVPPPMSRDERVVVFPPVEQPLLQSEWCHFYELGKAPDELRSTHWVNTPEHWARHFGSGKGLQGLPDPIWRVDGRAKSYPDMWAGYGLWAFSHRFMAILDQEAPGAFDRVPLRFEDRDGNFIRDDYVLADCIMIRKAIDWANSVVAYEYMRGDEKPMPDPSRICVRSDTVEDINIVRDYHRPSYILIRRSLVAKISKIKPKITNINFYPVW
jgi:hypothetical protein